MSDNDMLGLWITVEGNKITLLIRDEIQGVATLNMAGNIGNENGLYKETHSLIARAIDHFIQLSYVVQTHDK